MNKIVMLFMILMLSACMTMKNEGLDEYGNRVIQTCRFVDFIFYTTMDCKVENANGYY